jgi:DNA-damage-inducible protein J
LRWRSPFLNTPVEIKLTHYRISVPFDAHRDLRYNVSQGGSKMATTEMVHVRIDKRTKARAAKALAAMGLSVSDAVRVLLTRVAVEKSLPFEVKAPNAATAAAMEEARRGGLPSFHNVSDLMADLNAED